MYKNQTNEQCRKHKYLMKVIGVISFLGTVLDYVCHPGAIINSAPFHFHK